MSNRQEIRVPDLGDFDDVEVVEVHVKAGDQVQPEDPLITLETDKAAMEVPAPAAGTLVEVSVDVGSRVSEGAVIAVMDSAEAAADEKAETPVTSAAAEETVSGVAEEGGRRASTNTSSASPDASESSGPQPVLVPDLGDFDAADIAEVHIKVGDVIAIDDPLITLETD